MMKNNAICPVCGKTYSGYPSLSRKDNKTEICAACGRMEALVNWFGAKNKKKEGAKND